MVHVSSCRFMFLQGCALSSLKVPRVDRDEARRWAPPSAARSRFVYFSTARTMEENVGLFMSITGCDQTETAQFFLESSDNDVEKAVNMYMESGGNAGDMQTNDHDPPVDGAQPDEPTGNAPAAVVKPDDPEEHRCAHSCLMPSLSMHHPIHHLVTYIEAAGRARFGRARQW
jgi:UBA-like domain